MLVQAPDGFQNHVDSEWIMIQVDLRLYDIYIYIRLTYDKSTDLDISIYIYIYVEGERGRERERKQDLFYISINDISPMSPMEVFRFKDFP